MSNRSFVLPRERVPLPRRPRVPLFLLPRAVPLYIPFLAREPWRSLRRAVVEVRPRRPWG